MISAAFFLGLALADPAALREPGDVGLSVDDDTASVGAWIRPRLGVAASWAWPAESATLEVVTRHALWAQKTWAIEVTAGGGLVLPFRSPGIGLAASPALQLRTQGQRFLASVDLAAPVDTRLVPGQALRLSTVVSPRLGVRGGPLWLTAHLDVGATWTIGLDTRVILRPGLAVSVRPPQPEDR